MPPTKTETGKESHVHGVASLTQQPHRQAAHPMLARLGACCSRELQGSPGIQALLHAAAWQSAGAADTCSRCRCSLGMGPSCSFSTAAGDLASRPSHDKRRNTAAGIQLTKPGSPGPPVLQSRPPLNQVADLAMENAPTKLMQLVGDPRSGVADDSVS